MIDKVHRSLRIAWDVLGMTLPFWMIAAVITGLIFGPVAGLSFIAGMVILALVVGFTFP